MTSTTRPPAISGVSTGRTTEIARLHPSIAGYLFGQLLGQLLDSIPIKVGGIKLSHLLFGLPVGLLAAPFFLLLKVFGDVYVLTNRSVQKRTSLSNRPLREVPLTEIEQVVVRQLPGQQFYPAAELDLVNKAGDTVMTLSGVSRPDVFRQTILEARDSVRQIADSLGTIRAPARRLKSRGVPPRSDSMSLIGVDIGSSFVKAAVLDVDALRLTRIARAPFPEARGGLPPGHFEVDPLAIVTAVRRTIVELLGVTSDCTGILFCGQMGGVILADDRGEPLTNYLSWRDQRAVQPDPSDSVACFERLRRQLGMEHLRDCGQELKPGSMLSLLCWLRDNGSLPAGAARLDW